MRVDVWSDYVCPYCYLAYLNLKQLEDSHDLDLHWRSFELRPEGAPPVPEDYKQRILAARPQFIQTVKEQHGIDINAGQWGINSHASLVGAKVAEVMGAGDAYHDAALRAYWEEGKSLEDRAVLGDIAVSIGLDEGEFLAALDDPAFDAKVMTDIWEAQSAGFGGVPTMLFDEKYLLSGAYPTDMLANVIEKITAGEVEGA